MITQIHRRRASEFKKFLVAIDKAVSAELGVHLVCDHFSTHKKPMINDWLKLDQPVERWFAFLTDQLLRRSVHESVAVLKKDVRVWIATWSEEPKPFVLHKTAEEVLDSLARCIS